LSEAVDDYICFVKVRPASGGSNCYDRHACGLSCLYSLNCIFDDYTLIGVE
jgi:hypothetical protein